MMPRRVLLYCQHLTGVGHYIRTKALAHGLVKTHDVTVVVGGPPVPEDPWSAAIRRVSLPALERRDGRLCSLDGSPLETTMARRQAELLSLLEAPFHDVVVEHFPFGKWDMIDEILELLRVARKRSPGARVVCSVRDATDRSRFDDAVGGERAMDRVVAGLLREHVDGVWIHGDPAVFALTAHLPWLSEVDIPFRYTGYVVPLGAEGASEAPRTEVLVSGGGGRESFPVLNAAFDAWRIVSDDDAFRNARLVACCGPYIRDRDFARLEQARPPGAELDRTSPNLNERIAQSLISVSRAGYNSCVAALAGRTRMILAPSSGMLDQTLRSDALSTYQGTGVVVVPPFPTGDELARALRRQIDAERPKHDIRLDGVRTAVRYATG